MAKVPRAGAVKTRLLPVLSDVQAARLAGCFFQDTIANVSQITANLIAAYTPAPDRELLEKLVTHENLIWVEQKGEDLGIKLESAIKDAESFGFSPIITIGADSPTLPVEYVQKAIDELVLKKADVVLGPASDGGFYLVGLRKSVPNLFENIAWGTSTVYQQISENIVITDSLKLFELPAWYDVDTPHDLVFLRAEMLRNKELQLRAPKTYQWLISI